MAFAEMGRRVLAFGVTSKLSISTNVMMTDENKPINIGRNGQRTHEAPSQTKGDVAGAVGCRSHYKSMASQCRLHCWVGGTPKRKTQRRYTL